MTELLDLELTHEPPIAPVKETTERSEGPLRLAWRAFRRHRAGMIALCVLSVLYVICIFAGFIAPYSYDNEERTMFWAPPSSLHMWDENGFSWRPFIHPVTPYVDDDFNTRIRIDTSKRCYLRFFVPGDEWSFPGRISTSGIGLFTFHTRLFGVDTLAPSTQGDVYYSRFYLMGADNSGRDIFSRICYGSRVSLTIGLMGTALVFMIGLAVGGVSGFYGGTIDNILQRLCEMIMLLPGFYLLLMLRFMFPSNMDSVKVYFAVVLIMGLIGWPRLARVIRGMVLSLRKMDYVQSARAIGQTNWRIIRKHIIPNTLGYVVVVMTLSIPGYIIGESALSILGLGIQEPTASWGNMLSKAMDVTELKQHPWVLWPGFFIFITVMCFNLVGDGLRDAVDPRMRGSH